MEISVKTDNGYLCDKYSKYAESKYKINGNPIVSFPIEIKNISPKVKTMALTFVDFDSAPVCGFVWIHWLVANIVPTNEIPENASADGFGSMVQGANSLISGFVGETDKNLVYRYSGPTPPDKDHNYTLKVYGLDCELELNEGFYINELIEKMNGHIIEKASINVKGKC